MKIGTVDFDVANHTYVMGILNVTPDSFSDGGRFNADDIVLKRVEQMIAEGADIIDVGGESTRPGATYVEAKEELERVIPVIERIRANWDIPVSLDTYKSSVAVEGIKAGADMINDIWGLKYDGTMADAVASMTDEAYASRGIIPSVCIMHNRKPVGEEGSDNRFGYTDFLSDLESDLMESVNLARKAGIKDESIVLDPGVGFAKDTTQNLMAINCMDRLKLLGYPVLLGCSRKSVIGNVLNIPIDERIYGTISTSVMAVVRGAAFVRVHDVRANVEAVKMTEAILKV